MNKDNCLYIQQIKFQYNDSNFLYYTRFQPL